MPRAYRIGVDVGGTNTDAAIINVAAIDSVSRGVCASNKTPTTLDVTSGIRTAIVNVLEQTKIDRSEILSVAIGTTHFVNAVVEADARRLSKVAVIRLCGPFTRAVCASPPASELHTVILTHGADRPLYSIPGPLARNHGRASILP